ncbi:type II toxin-antitoxin system Phd/YefM family antitoxin [Aquipuribacter sp. MA13-6]|uniref:type II toxin-antitoxin system Phd/YefM family antitoxin n=1 Tax=unclassified Aquipuribacter TaxID=2635084 RepID=UPI003EEEFA16
MATADRTRDATSKRVLVTVHGTPSAVLIAPADLEALEETIAVLSDGDAVARLNASETELAAGLGESEADLAAAMRVRRDPDPS